MRCSATCAARPCMRPCLASPPTSTSARWPARSVASSSSPTSRRTRTGRSSTANARTSASSSSRRSSLLPPSCNRSWNPSDPTPHPDPTPPMMYLRKLLVPAISAWAFLVTSAQAFAQAAPHKGRTALELFETTGPVGYMIVGCSIAGTALVIEHMISLRREKLAPPEFAAEVEALIEEERYDEALELSVEEDSYLANLTAAGLHMRHAGYEEMIAGLEMAAQEETFKLNAKISYLSLIGNVAPLLGLLGTVTGMISSFQEIERLKSPTPGDLAKGVYESLVNTTMGLFVAIIFLTLYFLFKNRVTKLTLSMNLQAVDMLKNLATGTRAH